MASVGESQSSDSTNRCRMRNQPFRRCYCGLVARFSVSTSVLNPERRYFGCRFFPHEKEDCKYFEWYDEELSPWYKDKINELKRKAGKIKNPVYEASSEDSNSNLLFLIRVMLILVVFLIIIVMMLLFLFYKG